MAAGLLPAVHGLLPDGPDNVTLEVDGRSLRLTNLNKIYWSQPGFTKGDLLRYYAAMAPVLVPHLVGRPMVMKRYPHGAEGDFFFMKRVPQPHPEWLQTCSVVHGSGSVIAFPLIQDTASLLWIVNLGCIDLNPWYSRCDDVNRPDFLHFDLDPVPPADFSQVCRAALMMRAALAKMDLPCWAKTSGSSGMHLYVPIKRGPVQKTVWTFAKSMAGAMEQLDPQVFTAKYRIKDRPPGRVLVDYNQNAWGRTLASVYSPRPKPAASISTPVTWSEVEQGISITDFRLDNVPGRVATLGDLWAPLLDAERKVDLEKLW